MVLSTKLTQRLGIRHPVIQGGMHYVGYAPLAAAVSNAGAIGVVTALTQPNAEELRTEIQKTRSLLKHKDTPIGVSASELLSTALIPAACALCNETVLTRVCSLCGRSDRVTAAQFTRLSCDYPGAP